MKIIKFISILLFTFLSLVKLFASTGGDHPRPKEVSPFFLDPKDFGSLGEDMSLYHFFAAGNSLEKQKEHEEYLERERLYQERDRDLNEKLSHLLSHYIIRLYIMIEKSQKQERWDSIWNPTLNKFFRDELGFKKSHEEYTLKELFLAVEKKALELIAAGKRFNFSNLKLALEFQSSRVFEVLIKKVDPYLLDPSDTFLLENNEDKVKTLADKLFLSRPGRDLRMRYDNNPSPLYLACTFRGQEERILESLILRKIELLGLSPEGKLLSSTFEEGSEGYKKEALRKKWKLHQFLCRLTKSSNSKSETAYYTSPLWSFTKVLEDLSKLASEKRIKKINKKELQTQLSEVISMFKIFISYGASLTEPCIFQLEGPPTPSMQWRHHPPNNILTFLSVAGLTCSSTRSFFLKKIFQIIPDVILRKIAITNSLEFTNLFIADLKGVDFDCLSFFQTPENDSLGFSFSHLDPDIQFEVVVGIFESAIPAEDALKIFKILKNSSCFTDRSQIRKLSGFFKEAFEKNIEFVKKRGKNWSEQNTLIWSRFIIPQKSPFKFDVKLDHESAELLMLSGESEAFDLCFHSSPENQNFILENFSSLKKHLPSQHPGSRRIKIIYDEHIQAKKDEEKKRRKKLSASKRAERLEILKQKEAEKRELAQSLEIYLKSQIRLLIDYIERKEQYKKAKERITHLETIISLKDQRKKEKKLQQEGLKEHTLYEKLRKLSSNQDIEAHKAFKALHSRSGHTLESLKRNPQVLWTLREAFFLKREETFASLPFILQLRLKGSGGEDTRLHDHSEKFTQHPLAVPYREYLADRKGDWFNFTSHFGDFFSMDSALVINEDRLEFRVEYFLERDGVILSELKSRDYSLKEVLAPSESQAFSRRIPSDDRAFLHGGGCGSNGSDSDAAGIPASRELFRKVNLKKKRATLRAGDKILQSSVRKQELEEARERLLDPTNFSYKDPNGIQFFNDDTLYHHFEDHVDENNKGAFRRVYNNMLGAPQNQEITLVSQNDNRLNFKCFHTSTGRIGENSGRASIFWTYEEELLRVVAIGYHDTHESYRLIWVNEDWSGEMQNDLIKPGIYSID